MFCTVLSTLSGQVLSDGTLLMKEVRENIEELTCQVLLPLLINISITIMRMIFTTTIMVTTNQVPNTFTR